MPTVHFYLNFVPTYNMKVYVGVEVRLHSFVTSVLDGISGQLHASADLPTWINPFVLPEYKRAEEVQRRAGCFDSARQAE